MLLHHFIHSGRLVAVICSLLFVGAGGLFAAGEEEAALQKAAMDFYTALRSERIEGVPSGTELKRLAPHITPELEGIFKTAKRLQAEQAKREPDEKPDWIEGDLFGSLFEGATSWKIGEAFYAPTVDPTVKLDLIYSQPNQEQVNWTDTLVFKHLKGHWLVDNIRMGGKWAFKSGSSLRGRLPGGYREYEDHDSPNGKWHVTIRREGEDVVSIVSGAKDGSGTPTTLFGEKPDEPCPKPTWVVWNPNSTRIAIRLGDGVRFTRTRIFRLSKGSWVPVPFPELYPEERRTLDENGFHERHRLIDALRWEDDKTLVVQYFGNFVKGDEGDGYFNEVSIRIDGSRASVVSAVDSSEEP